MTLLDSHKIFCEFQKIYEESTASIETKVEQATDHRTSWEAVEYERGTRIGINKAITIINKLISQEEGTVTNQTEPEVPDSVIEDTVREIVALFKILDEYDASNYLGVETTYQLISDLMKWRYQK